jgi:hypothetical protein
MMDQALLHVNGLSDEKRSVNFPPLIQTTMIDVERALKLNDDWGMEAEEYEGRGMPHAIELANFMRAGGEPPPILLYEDYPIDGRHRLHAAQLLGRKEYPAIVLDPYVESVDYKRRPELWGRWYW